MEEHEKKFIDTCSSIECIEKTSKYGIGQDVYTITESDDSRSISIEGFIVVEVRLVYSLNKDDSGLRYGVVPAVYNIVDHIDTNRSQMKTFRENSLHSAGEIGKEVRKFLDFVHESYSF